MIIVVSLENQLIAQLSDALFWDTARSGLDVEKHGAFIIIRTMERGTKEEVLSVWNFYGETVVRAALLNAPSLSPETISFFANQFDISAKAFRSYKRAENWVS